jgi:hypothetical protein
MLLEVIVDVCGDGRAHLSRFERWYCALACWLAISKLS